MGRILKGYIFWTHERGSFHYDVMVSLILAFIFITPFVWHYGDTPQTATPAAHSVLVQVSSPGSYIFDVPAVDVRDGATPLRDQLQQRIDAVSGTVTLSRYEPVKRTDGKITFYRVWAHR